MGWIWVVVVIGLMVGAGLLIDRRRYRGVPVQDGLSWREKRRAVRGARVEVSRHQTQPPPAGYGGAAGNDGGG